MNQSVKPHAGARYVAHAGAPHVRTQMPLCACHEMTRPHRRWCAGPWQCTHSQQILLRKTTRGTDTHEGAMRGKLRRATGKEEHPETQYRRNTHQALPAAAPQARRRLGAGSRRQALGSCNLLRKQHTACVLLCVCVCTYEQDGRQQVGLNNGPPRPALSRTHLPTRHPGTKRRRRHSPAVQRTPS